jgi:carbamate kinase
MMSGLVVVLVNGEVLANGRGSKISDQRRNAIDLAEGLYPIFETDLQILVLHGNKPQVGFVLFRSEIASYALHSIPLDVCGADTQGATGYMLSQAFTNSLQRYHNPRHTVCVVTQTVVDANSLAGAAPTTAVGPWFDRDKAEQYRQTRGWAIAEEPGYGYRRAVPSLAPKEIVEIEGIERLLRAGNVVIAGGGGGIPVTRTPDGDLVGIEAVVETEQVAGMIATQLQANIMLMVVDKDDKYIRAELSTEATNHLALDRLDNLLQSEAIASTQMRRQLRAASVFLHNGGEQVVITTLRGLPHALAKQSGLRIGSLQSTIDLFQLAGS